MSKLIVLQGLPGSGKTTKAFDMMLENPSLERRSIKTALQHVLFPTEKMIQKGIELFYKKLEIALQCHQDILIDDVNLHSWHINAYQALAKKYEYDFQLIKLETSVDECYGRIIKRHQTNPKLFPLISHEDLEQMAKKLNLETEEDKEFVVYGLEDCIADTMERRFFSIEGGSFKQEKYYSEGLIHLDEIRHNVLLQIYNDIDTGYRIIIVTKRPEYLRRETEEWLKEHNVPYESLIMKSVLIMSPEHIWKYNVVKNTFDINLCKKIVDDNQDVLIKFETHGIEAVHCGEVSSEKIA